MNGNRERNQLSQKKIRLVENLERNILKYKSFCWSSKSWWHKIHYSTIGRKLSNVEIQKKMETNGWS
jgi:hypothetical protein